MEEFNGGNAVWLENVKFVENQQQMGFYIVLIAGNIWIIAMKNVIRMENSEHGTIAKNVVNVNTICTMFTE